MRDETLTPHLLDWKRREELAEALIPLIGTLYREHSLVVAVFGRSLVGKNVVEIITAHDSASDIASRPLRLADTVTMLTTLLQMDPGRARLDVGKLAVRFTESGAADLAAWTREALAPIVRSNNPGREDAQDVVLYGFGRIGRLLARILISKTGGGHKYRLRAVVLRPSREPDLHRRASLLARDSVHGPFEGTITVDEERGALIANGNLIQIIHANNPEDVDYTAYGIKDAIIIDNTGVLRDRAGLSRHLRCPGASRVLLTAPGKDLPNVVFGVNHQTLDPEERIVSAASCTTNAIVPVLKAVDDAYGITRGHIETIHAYTNDQNLIDNYHKKDRRGRGAALNMVITSTGAATAAAKALPNLAGKLTGNAIRVPTPNVSLAILNLELSADPGGAEALNNHLRALAADSSLEAQIGYTASPEVVSSDLVGAHRTGIIDSRATIVRGSSVVLYVWYDNEYGYSCQVVRLMQAMVGVSPRMFP
jgi:glyceraldehyde 3-phosphate dehydrogenase